MTTYDHTRAITKAQTLLLTLLGIGIGRQIDKDRKNTDGETLDTIRDEEGGGRRERRERDVMARVWS